MSQNDLSYQAKIDRRLSQRSLYYLCKEVLGYRDMVPHVHGDFCDFATSPIFGRFRQATMPRAFFKTWVWTVGKSIWLTLPDEESLFSSIYPFKGPNARILIASNVITNAEKMINKIKKEWESNSRLRAAFPELIPDFNKTRWSDTCAQIKRTGNYTEGTYTAVGVGGSVISQHFDHILEDDLIYAKKDDFTGMELMPSQEDIDNAIGWHRIAFSLFSDPNLSTMDNVGTRWAPHDLIDYIRKNETHFSCFEISATNNALWPVGEDSACTWPERYGVKALESIRNSQGAKIFETQYLNRPRAGEDVTFDMSYVHKHETFSEFPQDANYLTIIDVATWKDSKRICNNVVITGCKDENNHLWVARVDAGKYDPTELIELIKAHQKQFSSKVMIEEVGYQVAVRFFARRDMETSGHVYSIDQLPPDNRKGAKDLRIESLQPFVRNGMFHTLSTMKGFHQEMEDYPYGALKDQLDACGYLAQYTKPKGKPRQKKVVDPMSFEAVLDELEKGRNRCEYPFEIQLGRNN
jgi:hypothetical protein